jgi:hypothetical protein
MRYYTLLTVSRALILKMSQTVPELFVKDISMRPDVLEKYQNSTLQRWLKPIPLDKTAPWAEYHRRDHFRHICDVVLDTETKADGTRKRQTVVQFVPTIPKEDFDRKTEWIYIMTVNDRIVKIGGTRDGLKGRVGSYLCGHHIRERGKTGDCSKTNGFIYNTFEFYLNLGCTIEMYGYELPRVEYEIDVFGEKKKMVAQTYHAYESAIMEDYKKMYGDFPILCDNADPEYRS